MNKFYGAIGYAETVETSPGVHKERITERMYYGDILRNTRQLQSSGNLNDDINISNEISILADPYADNHFYAMRYAEFMGARWKITRVEVQPPRLKLTLGGLHTDVE